jgi:hypothetical protein
MAYPDGIFIMQPRVGRRGDLPWVPEKNPVFYAESVASQFCGGCNSFRVVVNGLARAPRVVAVATTLGWMI